jgi:hypothetical protein
LWKSSPSYLKSHTSLFMPSMPLNLPNNEAGGQFPSQPVSGPLKPTGLPSSLFSPPGMMLEDSTHSLASVCLAAWHGFCVKTQYSSSQIRVSLNPPWHLSDLQKLLQWGGGGGQELGRELPQRWGRKQSRPTLKLSSLSGDPSQRLGKPLS